MPRMFSRRLLWAASIAMSLALCVASLFCLHQDNGSRNFVEQIQAELDNQAMSEAKIEELFGKPGERQLTAFASDDPDMTQVCWNRKTWDRGFIAVSIRVDAKGKLHGIGIAECRPFWQWVKGVRSRLGI